MHHYYGTLQIVIMSYLAGGDFWLSKGNNHILKQVDGGPGIIDGVLDRARSTGTITTGDVVYKEYTFF